MNHQLYLFLSGFTEIANGLAKVVSFGYWIPNWDYMFLNWQAEKEIKRREKESSVEKD